MSYTHNEIELESLIDGINKTFYFVGEEGDGIDNHELNKLDMYVKQFKMRVEKRDSQGENP